MWATGKNKPLLQNVCLRSAPFLFDGWICFECGCFTTKQGISWNKYAVQHIALVNIKYTHFQSSYARSRPGCAQAQTALCPGCAVMASAGSGADQPRLHPRHRGFHSGQGGEESWTKDRATFLWEVLEDGTWKARARGQRGGIKKRKGAEVVGPRIWALPWPEEGFLSERSLDQAAATACGFKNTEEYVAALQVYANAPYNDQDHRVLFFFLSLSAVYSCVAFAFGFAVSCICCLCVLNHSTSCFLCSLFLLALLSR